MMVKDIEGYEGLYAIYSDGRVWSYRVKRFMKPADNGHGYRHVMLTNKNGVVKHHRVHILVAKAFLPPPAPGACDVCHTDDDPGNNDVSNLKWGTRAENLNTDRCREKQKNKIFSRVRCIETGEIFKSQAEAGRQKNIHRYSINNVLMGKQKTAGGYHWERVF